MLALLAQTEPASWVDILERGGLLAAAVLFIWGLLREHIVPGSAHRRLLMEERKRTDDVWVLANGVLGRIEKAVEIAKR